jgi:hypothetical protein
MKLRWLFLLLGTLLAQAPSHAQKPTDRAVQAREQFLNGGILTLKQEFGKAWFTRCDLMVLYYRPPLLNGTDRLELHCTPNVRPRLDDLVATRRLTADEVEVVAKLAVASDLYSGGHTGNFAASGSEGPFERLEVGRCCRREDQVILITTGNLTFSTGARSALLNLLHEWRKPLLAEVMNRKLR